MDRRAVKLHEVPPLGFPVVDRADPVDRCLEVNQARGIRERGAPLPCAGLRRDPLVPFAFRIPCLRQGRVDLVAARRTVEFRLVVEVRGSPESLLQARGSDQGSGPSRLDVEVLDFLRDVDPSLRRVLLPQALRQEEFGQRLQPGRPGLRILRRRQRFRQVGQDVVPLRGPLVLRQLHDRRVRLRHHPSKTRPG